MTKNDLRRTARTVIGWQVRTATVTVATVALAVGVGLAVGLLWAWSIQSVPHAVEAVSHGLNTTTRSGGDETSSVPPVVSVITFLAAGIGGLALTVMTAMMTLPAIDRRMIKRFGLECPDLPSAEWRRHPDSETSL